jgi:hypothetical protein
MVTGTWDGTTAKLYINDPQLTTKENTMSKLKWENPILECFDLKKTSGACNNGSSRFDNICLSGMVTIECGIGTSAWTNSVACATGRNALMECITGAFHNN